MASVLSSGGGPKQSKSTNQYTSLSSNGDTYEPSQRSLVDKKVPRIGNGYGQKKSSQNAMNSGNSTAASGPNFNS